MAKPVKPPNATDESYCVDLVSDNPSEPAGIAQTHLRHLLIACELGDLVLLDCERRSDGKRAFLICASVVSADNKRKLLPICELPDTADLLAAFRPPLSAEDCFVKPTHTGAYEVCLLGSPEEVALAEVNNSGDNVH